MRVDPPAEFVPRMRPDDVLYDFYIRCTNRTSATTSSFAVTKQFSFFTSQAESLSIGITLCLLARRGTDEAQKQRHVAATWDRWTRIKFEHLFRELDEEFGP